MQSFTAAAGLGNPRLLDGSFIHIITALNAVKKGNGEQGSFLRRKKPRLVEQLAYACIHRSSLALTDMVYQT